jgi:hypothetical protein
MVYTTVNGSTANVVDNEPGLQKLVNLNDGSTIANIGARNLCLWVNGNEAIIWHVFTTSEEPVCAPGELGVVSIVDNGNGTFSLKAINATRAFGVTSIPSCGESDLQYLQGLPAVTGTGIKIKPR